MHVKRIEGGDITATTTRVAQSWIVTAGTGRLARLRGSGMIEELLDSASGPSTLGGIQDGVVHH